MLLRGSAFVFLAATSLLVAGFASPDAASDAELGQLLSRRHEGHTEEHNIEVNQPKPMDMAGVVDHDEPPPAHTGHGPAHSHGPPKDHFDPSSIPPDPLSYFDRDLGEDGNGFLMTVHIVFMSLSWMGCLPLSLYLRAAKHPLYHFPQFGFVLTTLLGLLASLLYKAKTSDLYPQNAHAPVGWVSIVLAAALVAVDTCKLLSGAHNWWKSGGGLSLLPSALFSSTVGQEDSTVFIASPSCRSYELVSTEDAESGRLPSVAEAEESMNSTDSSLNRRQTHRAEHSVDIGPSRHAAASPSQLNSPPWPSPPLRSSSRDSTDTLHDNERHVRWTTDSLPPNTPNSGAKFPAWLRDRVRPPTARSKVSIFLKYLHIFFLRSLLCMGYGSMLLGLIVYTGKCRGHYTNGCAAHIIKGSIFLIWGLLSFARYLGAWSEIGWAWNAKPKSDDWRQGAPSAEFVESFLIFFYGSTNTFMERFGAKAGDPYSVHQIEHISIAILFFGAGTLSLLVESKRMRRWLSQGSQAVQQTHTIDHRTAEPPSYSGSFNPVPALVAALTGIAMGAHHQEYVYTTKIHQLWGAMLVAFAICRILTYAFLYLRPPASTLPSRPPTEVLASFFCACGGFTFMVSTEQVGYAAMTAGWDDVFMINNLCFASVGLLMSWQLILTAIKGWAASRMSRSRQ